MTPRMRKLALGVLLAVWAAPEAQAAGKGQANGRPHRDPEAVARLKAETGDAAEVSVSPATGTARFVNVRRGRGKGLERAADRSGKDKPGRALGFVKNHARVFGLESPDAQLALAGEVVDQAGATHLTFAQSHRGVPVFAGTLKAHFDAADELVAVNGTIVPDLTLDATPSVDAETAARSAVDLVSVEKETAVVAARASRLVVFRAGLAQGVPGKNHLAWETEVGNGTDVRVFVYTDAHTGKLIDRIQGVHDAMNRRAYNGLGLTTVPPSYPGAPYWVEGQAFPTPSSEANNMITSSKETYDIFANAFGRDSFDGAGKTMDAIFNRGYSCPNASWNGTFISFCPGMTSDDVTGHEWAHAYTEYTHGLIYAWQPGALNESYSDIFGETIDLINGRGTDAPAANRDAAGASCSEFTPFPPSLRINSPASIAGAYGVGRANFGPPLTNTGVTGDLVQANDGSTAVILGPANLATTSDGCQPFTTPAGRIAYVDRGNCGFKLKVKNAQDGGAAGVIIANVLSTQALSNMADDPTITTPITIPAVNISFAVNNLVRPQLAAGVNGSLRLHAPPGPYDNSYRWLVGEDDTAVGLAGALRDMWRPVCQGNPGKVSDPEYGCSTADEGGVHDNSGVPNHAFALIVDGGTYNGQTISGIGLTKAAHVYFRAMTVYQHPASDFADHADAIEQSAADLLGVDLADLGTGAPSGQVITPSDIAEIEKAMLAVEMRTPPTQCNFKPLLAQNPPDRCEAGTTQVDLLATDFETDPSGSWTVSHAGVTPTFTPRDWAWTGALPDDRGGSAFYAVDPDIGACNATSDESGVLRLDSPAFVVPSGVSQARLTFDHWIASEDGFDGGNVKISVNGGVFLLVSTPDYTFNAYNKDLVTVSGGNTNPMAGQSAFTGTDGGSVDGTWGRSHVNLAPYAKPGDTVRLRFEFGTDGCGGNDFGWYVDDVAVFACTPNAAPTVSIADTSVVEGSGGDHGAVSFTVTLSHASAQPVQVRYTTADGTASRGSDYSPIQGTDHVLTIPPLSISGTVSTRVQKDNRVEADEWFTMNLEALVNAAIADGQAVGTIVNDDVTP